jgi:Glycosyl transferase family 2
MSSIRPAAPRVSVIVSGQDSREAPAEGLESVLMQQEADIEVLLTSSVGDAGEWIPEDERLVLRGGSIRDLCEAARGEYVAFFDLDDLWITDSKLASQIDALDGNREACIACHRVAEFFQDGAFPARDSPTADEGPITAVDVLPNWSLAPRSSTVVRKKALDDMPPWCFEYPAWAIPLVLLAHGGSGHRNPRRLGLVRTRFEPADDRANRLMRHLALYERLGRELPARCLDALGDGMDKLRALLTLERTVRPGSGTVLVVTGGDEQLLDAGYRQAIHFPGETCGAYPGYLPDDGATAVDLLRLERKRGAAYLVIPSASLWWLQSYTELADHLDAEAALVRFADNTAVYSLRPHP